MQQPKASGMKYGCSCAAQQMAHYETHHVAYLIPKPLLTLNVVAYLCLLQVQKEVPVQKVVEKVVEVRWGAVVRSKLEFQQHQQPRVGVQQRTMLCGALLSLSEATTSARSCQVPQR
jgi:hypothetical protein